MKPDYIEVKNGKAVKVLVSFLFLLVGGFGLISLVASILALLSIPVFGGKPPSVSELIFIMLGGLAFFGASFWLWWSWLRFALRADSDGIAQTDGFRRQSVQWKDVGSYYLQARNIPEKQEGLYDPVLLNLNGDIVFRCYQQLSGTLPEVIEKRNALRQFIETHLEGKKIEAPIAGLDAEEAVVKSIEVNWKEKSVWWIVGRIAALLAYGLFWLGLSLFPMYLTVIGKLSVPKEWTALFMLPIILGPTLPHIIWLHFKKKRVLRELKMREEEHLQRTSTRGACRK